MDKPRWLFMHVLMDMSVTSTFWLSWIMAQAHAHTHAHTHVFTDIRFQFFVDSILRRELHAHIKMICLVFWEVPKLFSRENTCFGAHGGQKRAQDSLELELRTAMLPCGFWKPNLGYLQEPETAKPAPQPQSPHFLSQHPFTKPEFMTSSRLIGCDLWDHLSLLLCTGLTLRVSLGFYIGTEDPSPGPHACRPSSLPQSHLPSFVSRFKKNGHPSDYKMVSQSAFSFHFLKMLWVFLFFFFCRALSICTLSECKLSTEGVQSAKHLNEHFRDSRDLMKPS